MEREIVEKVKAQFGRQAERYAESRPHATGTSLDLMVEWATPTPTDRVLDVATGTGFTAFAFAAFARRVVATDLTANMLIQAHRLAGERAVPPHPRVSRFPPATLAPTPPAGPHLSPLDRIERMFYTHSTLARL